MFVRQALYDRAISERNTYMRLARTYKDAHEDLLEKWNDLVRLINSKGGKNFLENGTSQVQSSFSDEALKKLIMLCHPDKHAGKPIATEMTQKLNALRK